MAISDISPLCDATPRGGESAKKRRLSDAECQFIAQEQSYASPPATPRCVSPSGVGPDSPYVSDDPEDKDVSDDPEDKDVFAVHDMVQSLPSSPTSPARHRVIAKRRDRPSCLRNEEQAIFACARGQQPEILRPRLQPLFTSPPKASPQHARYTLQDHLGEGQYGAVHRAWDSTTRRAVAVKTSHAGTAISPHEAAAMRACAGHPHILRLLDEYTEGRHHVLVTQLAQGDLLTQLQERGPMDESRARCHAAALVSAVAALHSAGYCHRDIKLENLLLSQENSLLLADFGCAEPLHNQLNVPVGSPAYMPPELIDGAQGCCKYPCAGDMWSMGVVLYAMVAGEFPFEMATRECPRYMAFMQGQNDWPPQFSHELKNLLLGLLRAEPETRVTLADVQKHAWLTAQD